MSIYCVFQKDYQTKQRGIRGACKTSEFPSGPGRYFLGKVTVSDRIIRKADEINRLIIKNPIKRWEHACFQRFLRLRL